MNRLSVSRPSGRKHVSLPFAMSDDTPVLPLPVTTAVIVIVVAKINIISEKTIAQGVFFPAKSRNNPLAWLSPSG